MLLSGKAAARRACPVCRGSVVGRYFSVLWLVVSAMNLHLLNVDSIRGGLTSILTSITSIKGPGSTSGLERTQTEDAGT